MNIIDEALQDLRENGWIKHNFVNPNGAHCIRGAIFKMEPGSLANHWVNEEADHACRVIAAVAREQYPERTRFGLSIPGTISPFNDHNDTTFADVERVMEKASVKFDESAVL